MCKLLLLGSQPRGLIPLQGHKITVEGPEILNWIEKETKTLNSATKFLSFCMIFTFW